MPYVGPRQLSTSPEANQAVPSGVTATPRMLTGAPYAGGTKTGGSSNEGTNGFTGAQLCTQSCNCSRKPIAPALVRPPIQRRPSSASVSPNQSPKVMWSTLVSPVHGDPAHTHGCTWSAYHCFSYDVFHGSSSRCGGGKYFAGTIRVIPWFEPTYRFPGCWKWS